MVKHIRLFLDDKDYEELIKKKALLGDLTWEELLKRGGEIE